MQAETLLHLEQGQRVKPFAGKTDFLQVDLVGLLDNNRSPYSPKYERVSITDVAFKGVEGQVAVAVRSRIGTQQSRTPLGPVKAEIEFTDGIAVVRQVPLHLRLDFWLRSKEDWQQLLANRAILDLGNERYPVKYHLEDHGMTTVKFDQGLEVYFRNHQILSAFGSLVLPETHHPAHVLLPYNMSRLSQEIGLTMGT